MSSPSTTTDGSWPSLMSMAEFRAWIMFIWAMPLPARHLVAQLGFLPPQVLGHLLEDVVEHEFGIEPRRVGERPVTDRLLPGACDVRLELDGERLVPLFRPLAEPDQVVLQPFDRVAERELLVVVLGPVARRVVAGRMRRGTVGHVLDDRRAAAGARALGRPLRDGVDGEEV